MKIIFKNVFRYTVLLTIIVFTYYYRNDIANYILRKANPIKKNVVITNNSYYSNNNLKYVQETDDYVIHKRQDILNIFYTILNSGTKNYEFLCDNSYEHCLYDVEEVLNDDEILASINNMVHPYNSYENVSINVSNYGKIEVEITKIYNDAQMIYINNFINDYINKNITTDLSDQDKIKKFHDYIINETVFDIDTANNNNRSETLSHTAYGLIENHKAICGGYSDIMSIYLYMLNIPNYRIATNDHVWNLVYVDNKWLHLDLTWDDPVTSDGSNQLLYTYFLIDTNTLLKEDNKQHNFNEYIYYEANNNTIGNNS